MTAHQLNPDDFQIFSKVAVGLPGLKPNVSRSVLKELALRMSAEDIDQAELSGSTVTASELNELFHETARTGYVTEVVSPAGARFLVRLYMAGSLPMKSRHSPTAPSSDLAAYCISEPALEALQNVRVARRLAYEAKVANPQCITESEFTWALLNSVFWAHGKLLHEMVIGGVTVNKTVQRFASNSGKHDDFKVSFSWPSEDGKACEIEGYSKYEANRANDEKRNWGLYE